MGRTKKHYRIFNLVKWICFANIHFLKTLPFTLSFKCPIVCAFWSFVLYPFLFGQCVNLSCIWRSHQSTDNTGHGEAGAADVHVRAGFLWAECGLLAFASLTLSSVALRFLSRTHPPAFFLPSHNRCSIVLRSRSDQSFLKIFERKV